jgi:transcriptional regulator with XRE-family HTH domain
MKQQIQEKFIPDEDVLLKIQNTNDEEVSKMLIETRYQLGLSFKEMSIILGTPERTYRRWEAEGAQPSAVCMIKISKLRASYPYLFTSLAEPAIKKDDEKARAWLQEVVVHVNEQIQNLAREIALSVSKVVSETQVINVSNNTDNINNDTPKFDELTNRVAELEKQLAFLKEKATNPNKTPQRKYNRKKKNK